MEAVDHPGGQNIARRRVPGAQIRPHLSLAVARSLQCATTPHQPCLVTPGSRVHSLTRVWAQQSATTRAPASAAAQSHRRSRTQLSKPPRTPPTPQVNHAWPNEPSRPERWLIWPREGRFWPTPVRRRRGGFCSGEPFRRPRAKSPFVHPIRNRRPRLDRRLIKSKPPDLNPAVEICR